MNLLLQERRIGHNLRRARAVVDHRIIPSGTGNWSKYYLCPGCGIFLDREYVNYCDTCGQRLNWDHIPKEPDTDTDW